MSKAVPFKLDKVCDGCGARGAYDFMGDYYCQACTDKAFDEQAREEWIDVTTIFDHPYEIEMKAYSDPPRFRHRTDDGDGFSTAWIDGKPKRDD